MGVNEVYKRKVTIMFDSLTPPQKRDAVEFLSGYLGDSLEFWNGLEAYVKSCERRAK